jgi:hypothetical protein
MSVTAVAVVLLVGYAQITAAEKGDMQREGNQKFLGKLRGNMFGSEYLIFDEGENEKRTKKEKKAAAAEGRGELGMVIFPKELVSRGGACTSCSSALTASAALALALA